MKALAVFLFGLATTLAGAFIRSCNDTASHLTTYWCGGHPPALAGAHEHCAGCVLISAGMVLVALSPILIVWRAPLPDRVRQ